MIQPQTLMQVKRPIRDSVELTGEVYIFTRLSEYAPEMVRGSILRRKPTADVINRK